MSFITNMAVSHELIILQCSLDLKLLHFFNGDEMILPSQLFERFQWTDARGLVSVQALATLAVYLGQHVNDDVAEGVMSEFLHNMSHQALDQQNATILPQFS